MPMDNYSKNNNYNQYNSMKKAKPTNSNQRNQNMPSNKYYSQKKETAMNYMQINNNDKNNENYNNTFHEFNIMNNDLRGLSMENMNQRKFRSNSNIIKSENKAEEIQERFDELQNKLNQLQNILAKADPKLEPENEENNFMFQDSGNDFGKNNDNNFNIVYKQNTYNPRFHNNNLIKNFNNNNNNIINPGFKDLNQIHNQMQNRNPRASLLKKMTQFHLNDGMNNNYNNDINMQKNRIINNNNNKKYNINQNKNINNNNKFIYNTNQNQNTNNFLYINLKMSCLSLF